MIDLTAPGAIDTASRCAPGPAINVYPRGKRGLRGWLRRLRGR